MTTDAAPSARASARASALASRAGRRESLALTAGAAAFILAALVALAVLRLSAVPITGSGSIGRYSAIAAAVVAALAFAAGRILVRGRAVRITAMEAVDVGAVSVGVAAIALLSWTLLAEILSRAFIGATVFALPAVLIAGAVAAITAYICLVLAAQLDLQLLAILLALLTTEGLIASMLTASDPHWWVENLSALGATDDFSAFLFNATLIVSGVIVTVLSRSAVRSLHTSTPSAARWVRGCLVVIGIFLACVGIFHADQFFVIHTAVASGMAVAYAILVVGLRVWAPQLPRTFITLGWLFVAVLAVQGVFYATGYYTLTAVELVSALLIFSWLVLLLRNIAAVQTDVQADVQTDASDRAPRASKTTTRR